MVQLFANSGDPDLKPRSSASDLGLHCLQVTRLGSPVFNGLIVYEFKLSSFVSFSYLHFVMY